MIGSQPPTNRRRTPINDGWIFNIPCGNYPDCEHGNSCYYQHFECEPELSLSQIYQQITNNDNNNLNSNVNLSNNILYQLANKLSINNSFRRLKIGQSRFQIWQTHDNTNNPSFTRDTINISEIRNHKIIDIMSIIQHYQCKLDELTVNIWHYPDMNEISSAICSWLPSNDDLMKLDLSYFNYGFHIKDFNNLCRSIKDNLAFIKMFGISGRSQNQSMIQSLYEMIRTTTSLTDVTLKLIYDTNGGCYALNTRLLIDGLFENEMYLEKQIKEIENNLDISEVCVGLIIDYVFGDDVLRKALTLNIDLVLYGVDDYARFHNTIRWKIDDRMNRLKIQRQRNKSKIERQIIFRSTVSMS